MGSEHRFAELGECLSLIIDHRGKTPKKLGSDWVERGVPTISAKNVSGGKLVAEDSIRYVTHDVYKCWMKKDDVKRGDCFLVSEGATLGECMYWDEDYPIVLGQRLFCLRANPKVLYSRYLYFYMTSHSFQSEVIARATGTSVPGLRQTEVLKLRIRLPPIEEQRAIGDTLYNLNKKIELNQRMSDTLEAMARVLFKSWFVDFDPVRAKAEGRDHGLSQPLATLLPDSFEDSELGEIPKGWKVEPLSEITTVITKGTTPTQTDTATSDKDDGEINYIRVNAIDEDGTVLFQKLTKIPESVHLGILKRSILQAGDILYTIAGTIGRSAIVDESLLPANTNQAIAIIRPKQPIPAAYLMLTMRAAAFREELHSNIVHAVQANLSLGMLSRARAVVPPKNNLPQLFMPIANITERVASARAESRTLTALRDTLLPKLISGEVRVKDAEKMVGMLA